MKNFLKSNLLNDHSSTNHFRGSLGHCMYNYITGLLLSKKLDFEFIHSDLTNSSSRFNRLLNLRSEFKSIDDIEFNRKISIPSVHLNLSSNLSELERFHNPDYDYMTNYIKKYVDYNYNTLFELGTEAGIHFPGKMIDDSEWIIEKFQRAYWKKNNLSNTIYNAGEINVAIHMRRGDVKILAHPDRWKNDNHYIELIKILKEKIPNANFFIFTEGEKEEFLDFQEILNLDSNFHKFSMNPNEKNNTILNNKFEGKINIISGGLDTEIFHHLVSSSYLVTGQSTFSTLACYFNKGIIIYTPCINFARFEKFDSEKFINIKDINSIEHGKVY